MNRFLLLFGIEGEKKYYFRDFDFSIKKNIFLKFFLLLLLLTVCILSVIFTQDVSYMDLKLPRYIIFVIPFLYAFSIISYILTFSYGNFETYVGNIIELKNETSTGKNLHFEKTTVSMVTDDDIYYSFVVKKNFGSVNSSIAVYVPKNSALKKAENHFSLPIVYATSIIEK